MITLRKYNIDDWKKIDDAVEPFMFREPLDDFNKVVQRGVAATAIENDSIMACGGITYMNEKEGIVWIKVSRKCLNHPLEWARVIRETFNLMAKSVGSLSISTYILDNFCKGEKLARLIGLKRTDETGECNSNTYNKYTAVI